ncbi:hypothetical protein PV08_09297 [Exophiala spinifera]|uniref:FAD/NAD(P)-binding domain-containing protein n=1 Tax=Exophiala spinifera TaxID=91928 RepID=A0A0D2AZD9_9EURO|nr:uncharacterized protein PV08_09297 [Exophiala spinifera]KIW12023.1 hypothetical protein PV08_09297 [Exophiala spinifera]
MITPTRVVVIGAGWAGLVAAKTYLQIAQSLNRPLELIILDEGQSPGGVWSPERIYPGLVAETPNGFFEYSDYSMDEHPAYERIPAKRVSWYLDAYSRKFNLRRYMQFGVKVIKARRLSAGGWAILTSTGQNLQCDKLIVATGLQTKPKVPSIPQRTYTGHSIHSKDIGSNCERLIADSTVKEVVIVGGCKSAMDACAIFRAAGKKVSWVVRPSPFGVRFGLFDPNQKPNIIAVANVRLFSTFAPSVFDRSGLCYKFLHSGHHRVGTRIMNRFWKSLTSAVHTQAAYQSQNSRRLQPEISDAFWESAYTSIIYKGNPFLKWLQDDDLDRLQVYRATPLRLEGRDMVMNEDGHEVTIKADAVVWCTGWQSSLDFFDPEESARLGIPIALEDCEDFAPDEVLEELDSRLDREQEILSMFPQLQSRPTRPREPRYTQFRMYRQVLSPELIAQQDRSIAFVGFVATPQTSVAFELVSLWAVAWMEDLLAKKATPDLHSMQENVSLLNAWTRTRYGFREWRGPEFVYEAQGYFDELSRDLGLAKWRKRKGAKWWEQPGCMAKEWLVPYRPRDYRGMIEEFLSNRTMCQDSLKESEPLVDQGLLEKAITEYKDGSDSLVRVRTREVDTGSC